VKIFCVGLPAAFNLKRCSRFRIIGESTFDASSGTSEGKKQSRAKADEIDQFHNSQFTAPCVTRRRHLCTDLAAPAEDFIVRHYLHVGSVGA
jgi:hypothetical protein